MKKDSALQFYLDTLVIQAAFGDEKLQKQAEGDTADQLISAVKSYIGSKIDQNDKVGSIINILAPGAVTLMLRSLGLGWLAFIAGVAMNVFHVDVNSIIQSILGKILPKIKEGGKFTTEEIQNTVEAAFAPEANKEPSAAELEQLKNVQMSSKSVEAFTVREALLYRFGMEEAIKEYELTKNAGVFDIFSSGRKGTVSLLSKVVKWIFLVVLTSLGLMVAGDAVNKILGRSNSFDGTIQNGKPTDVPASPAAPVSTQTKFKLNPGYNNKTLNSGSATWVEQGPPNASNVRNMVLNWMTEVYEGTSQYKSVAAGTAGFNNVVQEIVDYNSGNTSGKITYIPRMFSTKKSAVDTFIDEVANKAGSDSFTPKKPGTITV